MSGSALGVGGGKEESFYLHGAYLLVGKTDNKQINKLPSSDKGNGEGGRKAT